MSKLAAIATAGAGATATALGGAYMLKKESGGDATSSTNHTASQGEAGKVGESAPKTPISADLSNFTSLDEFKKLNGGDCGKYFNDLNLSGSAGTPIDNTHKVEANYFNGSENAQSCLVVNWERTDSSSSGSKWKGYFRWIWSFVEGNKGFIAFSTTKLSSSEKQLDLEGGIYFLNKGDNNSGSIEKYKTLDDKKINGTTFSTALSTPGDALTDITNKNSWGFMSSTDDLDNVCKKDEESTCTQATDTKKIFKGSWTWAKSNENASSGTLIKGCKEFESYFSSMYSEGEIAIKDSLEALSGAWKKEVLEEPVATR